ncbi:MAG: hypothetical protein J5918_05410 [Prevotella sp.]|jgi:hypothetical protein|nr:hypothetical protein [Prevotella sp.]
MKKEYIVPNIKVKELEAQPMMAASGPGGGDAVLPGMTDDGDDGPGAGDFGGTPGFGGNSNSNLNKEYTGSTSTVWGD